MRAEKYNQIYQKSPSLENNFGRKLCRRMLCGVSGSLLLLEERKDIKSCNLLQLPLSPLSPNLFLQLGQKLELRSIFLGLQPGAAVLFIPAREDAAAIQLSMHHTISIVGEDQEVKFCQTLKLFSSFQL